jgi:AcrR family transcriptional regulator
MPRPKKLELRAERQKQILQAARTIFAQKGLDEARMDDIALVSGLSKGTLYLYYKDKDELVAGLLQATFDDLLSQLNMLIETGELSVEATMMRWVAGMIHYMETDSSSANIAYEFYAIAARRPHVRQYLQHYFAEYRRVLETLFSKGIERGEYARLDVSQSAIALIALLEGFTLLWFTDPKAVQVEQVLPSAVQHFLNSLK